jgi:hypothetical protein
VRGIPSTKRGLVINQGGMANYTMMPVFTHPLPKAVIPSEYFSPNEVPKFTFTTQELLEHCVAEQGGYYRTLANHDSAEFDQMRR